MNFKPSLHKEYHFGSRELAEANRIIGEVVRQQPNNFNALHLLGIIACQTYCLMLWDRLPIIDGMTT
jgi:hypothetical protein